jgi:hypothetical protein
VGFWQALEAIPGPAAVTAEWRQHVGDGEFEHARKLLRPRAGLADGFPRRQEGQVVMPYRVVRHGPDEFVGVDDHGNGSVITLTRDELIVYELDRGGLARAVAAALGLGPATRDEAGLPHGVVVVGRYEPLAGFSFPAFLTIPRDERHLMAALGELTLLANDGFVLVAPTARRLHTPAERVIWDRKLAFLALCDAVEITAGGLVGMESGRRVLEQIRQTHVPLVAAGSAFFPTPAAATWSSLRIRFVDGHTISVAVGDVTGVFHYSQLGMADGRNAQPTKQWELLRSLARGYGVLTWRSRDADPRNQKRRELLAKDLRAFFRIDGEPIVLTDDGKGWRTSFALEPES